MAEAAQNSTQKSAISGKIISKPYVGCLVQIGLLLKDNSENEEEVETAMEGLSWELFSSRLFSHETEKINFRYSEIQKRKCTLDRIEDAKEVIILLLSLRNFK